jgi:hypothetical protein
LLLKFSGNNFICRDGVGDTATGSEYYWFDFSGAIIVVTIANTLSPESFYYFLMCIHKNAQVTIFEYESFFTHSNMVLSIYRTITNVGT